MELSGPWLSASSGKPNDLTCEWLFFGKECSCLVSCSPRGLCAVRSTRARLESRHGRCHRQAHPRLGSGEQAVLRLGLPTGVKCAQEEPTGLSWLSGVLECDLLFGVTTWEATARPVGGLKPTAQAWPKCYTWAQDKPSPPWNLGPSTSVPREAGVWACL